MSRLALAWALAALASELSAPQAPSKEAPVSYRCDRLRMARANNQGTCDGNVVVRQRDLLLCCKSLVGTATPDGAWQSFVCEGDVRGAQGDLYLWAGRAAFDAGAERLQFTDRPRARRGGSTLWGRKMVISTSDGALEVDTPRGHLLPQAVAQGAAPSLLVAQGRDELPPVCPLPPGPNEAAPTP